MIRLFWLPALTVMAALLSCSNRHLIADKSSRSIVFDDYRARAERFGSVRSDLFSIARTTDNVARREAVCFLLAYMPLSDLAVYEPGYLTAHVDAALRSRAEMPWGPTVPSDLFLNFVLPPRVNNENPDEFRLVTYDELKDRVRGLAALEAALEINRWCQEKVAYQPSDSRTSSPLATILSARGRCGEESTFTVSALRTAGIPARQVYTPRWAHTDDNHAWVEFWADGRWYYMGACEPEPVPDRGWFTEPARRAMLVHTRAFGHYSGGEKLVRREKLFSEINTLDRYAVTKELKIRVTDTSGLPVAGAETGFMLYNYAEFYPIARLKCDQAGECSLTTGLGSLLIWAEDGIRCGFTLASASDTIAEVRISSLISEGSVDLDLTVPPVLTPYPGIDAELLRENNRAIRRGDSIRNAYIISWQKGINAVTISDKAGIPEERILKILEASMGNYRSISSYIEQAGSKAGLAIRILENISSKDLRDTPAEVLNDHLTNAPDPAPSSDRSLYDSYVLSPRIANEILTPFRSSLAAYAPDLLSLARENPASLAQWIDTAITIMDDENHYKTPIIPAGVLRLRASDSHSRNIFFVAVCRSAGIPSRLAPGTGRPQYHEAGEWHDAWFAGENRPSGTPGFLTFVTDPGSRDPQYSVHFTLARLDKGKYNSLDFGDGVKLSDLPASLKLDPGMYMLTTGNRDDNGNVLASVSFFILNQGEKKTVTVRLREIPQTEVAEGRINLDAELETTAGDMINPISLAESGIVFIWVEPGREPTRHLLNDLPRLKGEFDALGVRLIFLTDPAITSGQLSPSDIAGAPAGSLFVADTGLSFMRSALGEGVSERRLPLVLCCNSEGEILFLSEGYRIGTGEQILKKIR